MKEEVEKIAKAKTAPDAESRAGEYDGGVQTRQTG
jgi:hypothetical protein